MTTRAWSRREPRWSRAELIELLQRDAVDGVAPPIDRWRKSRDRPSPATVDRYFQSWSAFVRAAGLVMARQAPAKRTVKARAAKAQEGRANRAQAKPAQAPALPKLTREQKRAATLARRRRQEREAERRTAREEYEQALRDGSMRVRKFTRADERRLEQERRRRLGSPEAQR